MRRAVFSLVMEQMSFKRTVSWHRTETEKENKQEAALTESGEACSPGTSSEEADHRLCASQLLRNFLRDHLVESLISEAVEQASLEAQGFLDSWSGELAFSFVYSLINMHRSHHHLPLTETQNPGTGWDLTVTYLVIISHFIL